MLHRLLAGLVAFAASVVVVAQSSSDECTSLITSFPSQNPSLNSTIINASLVSPLANFSVPGTCQSSATNGNLSICRVEIIVNTTDTSSVHMEAWLPDGDVGEWNGRMMSLGNGGLGGC